MSRCSSPSDVSVGTSCRPFATSDRRRRTATAAAPCDPEQPGGSVRSAEFVLALLIAVAALVTIARRLGIAYPIFLVIGGLLLGLVPGLPRPDVQPDLIFLLVLPPILYTT